MRIQEIPQIAIFLAIGLGAGLGLSATAQEPALQQAASASLVRSRVVEPVDESKLVRLHGDTFPLAQPRFCLLYTSRCV